MNNTNRLCSFRPIYRYVSHPKSTTFLFFFASQFFSQSLSQPGVPTTYPPIVGVISIDSPQLGLNFNISNIPYSQPLALPPTLSQTHFFAITSHAPFLPLVPIKLPHLGLSRSVPNILHSSLFLPIAFSLHRNSTFAQQPDLCLISLTYQ